MKSSHRQLVVMHLLVVFFFFFLTVSCRSLSSPSLDLTSTTFSSEDTSEEDFGGPKENGQLPEYVRNVDVDDYLKNTRAVHFQIKCVLSPPGATHFCDPIGKWLRGVIPELIRNGCRHCSPDLRKKAGKIVAHIQQNHPEAWNEGVKRFGQPVTPISRGGSTSTTISTLIEDEEEIKEDFFTPTTTTTTITTTLEPTPS